MSKKTLLILLFCMPLGMMLAESSTSVTNRAWKQKKQVYMKPNHYLGLGAKLGYSQFAMPNDCGLSTPGGANAGLEFRYKLEKDMFRFTVGLDASYMGNSVKGLYAVEKPVEVPTKDLTYFYNFDIREQHNVLEVGLPIMVGANFSGFYAQAGVRLGVPVMQGYSNSTVISSLCVDKRGIDSYEDMINHGLYTKEPRSSKGALSLELLDPQVAVEVGMNLDPYLQQAYRVSKTLPSFVQLLHYEVALYANVGVLDYNTWENRSYLASTVETADHQPRPISDINVATVTSYTDFTNKQMVPWNVGVKFHVYYEFYEKPKAPQKKKRRPKPEIPPVEEVVEEVPVVVPVEEVVYNGDTIQQGDTITMENLYFDTDKSTIRSISTPVIEELAQVMKEHSKLKITLVGHTDNVGKAEYNQRLSESRVVSVKNELVKRGIDAERIQTIGKGMTEPIADNRTKEGRAQNRRVEIIIDEL